ncbi:hypothetical protein RJ639_023046, partial [Escallonia herrerae]
MRSIPTLLAKADDKNSSGHKDGNNSDREKSDASRLSHKPQRRGRGKVQLSGLKELLQSQLGTSSEGCLSLLKRRPSDGCTVGKRTPRFPISISLRKGDSSPNIRGWKSMVDDDVAHVAALALTKASQGGGTPQISQSSYRTDRSTSSPLKSWERMSEMDLSKLCGIMKDQDYTKGSMGRRVAENGDYAKQSSGSMDTESVGMVEGHRKRKKVSGRRVKAEVVGVNNFDDGQEACSDTEGVYVGDLKGNAQTEVTYAKVEQFSSQGRRKRNKKHISGAYLRMAWAYSTQAFRRSAEKSDSYGKKWQSNFNSADRLSVAKAVSTSQQRENIKLSGVRQRELRVFSEAEASTSGKSNLGREPTIDISVLAEVDQQPQPPNTPWRRQSKSSVYEVLEVECHMDPRLREPSKIRLHLSCIRAVLCRLSSLPLNLADIELRRDVKCGEGFFVVHHVRSCHVTSSATVLRGQLLAVDHESQTGWENFLLVVTICPLGDSRKRKDRTLWQELDMRYEADWGDLENLKFKRHFEKERLYEFLTGLVEIKGRSREENVCGAVTAVNQATPETLAGIFMAFAEAEGTLCTAQTYGPSEQWESRRPADCSSSGSDQTRIETDSAVLTSQVPTKDLVIVPTKRKSRRKMDPKRVPINKEMKSSEVIFNDWPYKYSTLQEKFLQPFICFIILKLVTKTVDLMPCWFSSLGKPRRFCENFLHEEREKLKQYRQSVRKHYSELRAGVREGLPTDLARPLSVGQRVIAIHPKSREVHDGRVLTVDHDKCRIQFDRPELGVEFVMASHGLKLGMVGFVLSQGMTDVQFQDIDCLPLNPLENMPEALRRQNIPID